MKAPHNWLVLLIAAALIPLSATPAASAAKAGQRCTAAQAYKVVTVNKVKLQCLKSGTKYVWTKVTTPKAKPAVKPSNPIKSADLIDLKEHKQASCSGSAPADWTMIVGSQSAAADLWSPDKSMVASWGLIVVPAVRGGWGTLPPYNDPDVYSSDPAVSLLAHLRYYESATNPAADLAFTSDPAEKFGVYTARIMRSSQNTIMALYTTVPGDGMSSAYIIVVRLARTSNAQWAKNGGVVSHYALSIKCTTQLVPVTPTPKPTTSKKPSSSSTDDDGYNPWLGSEYVHDPKTGTNHVVTPDQWSDTGPNGPGYYEGNNQLSPGRAPGT